MWIDFGGVYLNFSQYCECYIEVEKMLVWFGLEVAWVKVKIELEEQEDMFKDFNCDLECFVVDKECYEWEI